VQPNTANSVPSITVDQVPADAYVLDVREDDEWAAGHAPTAVHVPMADVPARLDELPDDKPIVVTCRGGGRSSRVVAWLQSQGINDAVNLDGGMKAWSAAGRDMTADSGEPHVI
jgi:rhodanese-related sulfurtransferase